MLIRLVSPVITLTLSKFLIRTRKHVRVPQLWDQYLGSGDLSEVASFNTHPPNP